MATLTVLGPYGLDMDGADSSLLLTGVVGAATATTFAVEVGGNVTTYFGEGFTYDGAGHPSGGLVNRFTYSFGGTPAYEVAGVSTPLTAFWTWASTGDEAGMQQTVLAGPDVFSGSGLPDLLRAYGGADSVSGGGGADALDGGAGADTVYGGPGDDQIIDPSGSNYLRGDEGGDLITGGANFDDINGNMGNDSCAGGLGDDWVVGGKDNDMLFGEVGDDIVYGNLGNDSCSGGDGADIVRGGQQDDVLLGGAGNDWLSGDRNNDTISGGAGADVFHTFGEAGIDRVTDFNLGEGDRVMLDPGTVYAVAQVGADTVITMIGGGQMTLVGVQLSTLTPGWIFGAA